MAESKTSIRRLAAIAKQQQALELRKAGVSYVAIADTLGYSGPSGAFNAIQSALKRTLQEPADDLRTIEVARLDAMLLAIWPGVKQGNYGAIDRAIRIMERRARLLGLDAPARADLTTDGGPLVFVVRRDDPVVGDEGEMETGEQHDR